MFWKAGLLVAAMAMLEGLAAASCTPGYAGSGYYRLRDCGLRLGVRAYSSPGYTYGYGYGVSYGHAYGQAYGHPYGQTIDALIPTVHGLPLSYGYPQTLPYIPNFYSAPYSGPPHGGYGVVPGLRYSPRSPTRVRPRRWSHHLPGTIRPGLRSGLGDLVESRSRSRLAKITRLRNGVWINP